MKLLFVSTNLSLKGPVMGFFLINMFTMLSSLMSDVKTITVVEFQAKKKKNLIAF